jgi:hypothetical protein
VLVAGRVGAVQQQRNRVRQRSSGLGKPDHRKIGLVARIGDSCGPVPFIAKLTATSAASTMKPIWAQVEAANNCFRSRCAAATAPNANAVNAPSQATSGPAHYVSTSRSEVRTSR